jgi:hypothetical protein
MNYVLKAGLAFSTPYTHNTLIELIKTQSELDQTFVDW